jgi:hypothetical protein
MPPDSELLTVSLETMVQKYNTCVAALDESKYCGTCKYIYISYFEDEQPCKDCYNKLLGMPINPTGWVSGIEEATITEE